jgi:hypothetical protein
VGHVFSNWIYLPRCSKSDVPAMYLTSANLLFLGFLAFNEINKLRVISKAQNSAPPPASRLPNINWPASNILQ